MIFKKFITDNFQPPERLIEKPLRICINDVFKGVTGGFCLAGKIESGFIRTGDKVLVMPAGEEGSVKGIFISFENKLKIMCDNRFQFEFIEVIYFH